MRSHKNIIWMLAVAGAIGIGWPARADAQGRHYRPVMRSRVVVFSGYGYGYYPPPWYYDPWFGFYDYQFGPYPPYPYPYRWDPGASLRLEVKPEHAEVYVDGYYAGVVDDFDGVFQRLSVAPGEHDIELYLDGYRTVHQRVFAMPRKTVKLKYQMERLAAGETTEPRPEPPPPPQAGAAPGAPQPPMPPSPAPPPRRGRMPPPQAPPAPGTARGADVTAYGSISIRVQPPDADVSIDGEKWRGPEAQDRLVVQVPEGRHTVEIQKSGYRTYVTEVQVRAGETSTLNVSLRSQDEQQ